MWMIVSGYVVLQLTDSTFQTQLVGVSFFAPMLLGGVLSGVIADGFDRRRVLVASHLLNILTLVVASVLVLTERAAAWHIFLLTLAFGSAHTLDMAARRTFAFDLVGRDAVASAIALESMSMTGSQMVGPFLGGILLDRVPLGGTANAGAAYLTMLLFYLAAFAVILQVRPVPRPLSPLRVSSVVSSTAEGLRAAAGNRAVLGILGVTILVNLTFFPYMPLVPVFAEKVLEVDAALMGLLGSAQGMGAMIGATFIATRASIPRKSRYYVTGSLIALASLFLFSLSQVYPLSFLALVCAGIGISGFGTMQATMVLLSADESTRGRAMGILSMAIGVLPLAMLGLGGLAEAMGPGRALTVMTSLGIVLILLWTSRAREMRQL
jgi:MFS family permease